MLLKLANIFEKLLYNLWLYSYNHFTKNGPKYEKMIFWTNPGDIYKYNSYFKVSFLHKIVLLYFYNPLNCRYVTIFFDGLEYIYLIRFRKTPKISEFFSNFTKHEPNQNPFVKKHKYNYSVIKNTLLHNKDIDLFFILNCVNFHFFEQVRFYNYWIKRDSFPNIIEHIFTKKTLEVYAVNNIKTLLLYLSDDLNQSRENDLYKKNNFYNININAFNLKNHGIFAKKTMKTYKNVYEKYNDFYFKFAYLFPKKKFKSFLEIYVSLLKYKKYKLDNNFKNFYKKLFLIKYKPTDATQFLSDTNVTVMFLRKNKIFNKGRYSRNRQLYRTGVYWCLWLNIINVFGLYYYFYRFVFNFGYFYIPLLILILSIFGSRLVKYRFYNPTTLINEFLIFFKLFRTFSKEFIIYYVYTIYVQFIYSWVNLFVLIKFFWFDWFIAWFNRPSKMVVVKYKKNFVDRYNYNNNTTTPKWIKIVKKNKESKRYHDFT